MDRVTVEYALEVAAESEATIISHGGSVLASLPFLDRAGIRPESDLIGRSLALNAIIDLNFNVPDVVVRRWLEQHGVATYLTDHEVSLLDRGPERINEQDRNNLAWSLDALWALMWAGNLFEHLDFTRPIPDEMYEMCPHVRDDDGPTKFADRMAIRSFDEIYRSLDLHYRLHWYAFQNQLRDERGTFDLSRFIERRRALEWLLSPGLTWGSVSMNT
ncbi:DUF4272 domain-containing protein [Stieleria varia]|uniref:DUF4272 domain-containing protein n=1 Tax=Stieleria varia TaxID=2528005 RepID=A0A5C6B728_9BACT|nr:DUF4272 domain-containing protein [Stieleria varia]TWU07788.1 hypothetical protein Pla52n_03620 [Stieleria varia]